MCFLTHAEGPVSQLILFPLSNVGPALMPSRFCLVCSLSSAAVACWQSIPHSDRVLSQRQNQQVPFQPLANPAVQIRER
jgi:hypothetical protein